MLSVIEVGALKTSYHMMFKRGMCAQENWWRLRSFNYLAQIIGVFQGNYRSRI